MHELLVREAYECELIGNFDIVKTLDVLHDIFIGLKWKKMCNAYLTNVVINEDYFQKVFLSSVYINDFWDGSGDLDRLKTLEFGNHARPKET